MRYVRILEIVLGLVFIVSAAGKALGPYQFAVQVSYYGVVTEPSLVQTVAYFMIVLETIFGVCLLAGLRWGGFIYAATVALLLGFSGLVVYAWSYRGLEDCGCVGKLIQMGPKSTLAKNVVLIGLAVAAWVGLRKTSVSVEPEPVAPARTRTRYALAGAGALAVVLAAAFGEGVPSNSPPPDVQTSDGPFGKFVFTSDMGEHIDLGTGDYFVIMLSATCEHCQAVSATLNEIMFMPDVPTTVGLLIAEDDEELDEFNSIAQPMFITHVIDSLEWANLISRKGPPRFYVIRDGYEVRYLDSMEPTLEELYDFVVQPSESGEP
jgi:hypothetical protein